ncbi:proton-conducting transporter membrane subunit [Planctomycetaceae bacterium SH139]
MGDWLAFLVTLPAVSLFALAGLPNVWANRWVHPFRQFVTLLVTWQAIMTTTAAVALATGFLQPAHSLRFPLWSDSAFAVTVYYDTIASLMLAMVSLVGAVICRYSTRYLDGEPAQGRYFRWTAVTIGAVSLMVVSGNLPMLVITWVLTSLGLHQLLMHYGDRPAARRAAFTKFTISRLGDVALVAAAGLIYAEFGTAEFAEIFAAIPGLAGATPGLQVAAFLLIFAGCSKSAQFPFHTWLPQSMETPTPVSALMHAGIVNAGGYLMIRTSPLVSLTPIALTTLALIGCFTVCFAAVVMITQTNVKKTLAYSTIAQMGFMMLQCGLGAYSAAMLHILAHSLYKAHAFLRSGSVISDRLPVSDLHLPSISGGAVSRGVSWGQFAAASCLVAGMFACILAVLGINPLQKQGGVLLGGVLCLSLAAWVGQALQTGNRRLAIRASALSAALLLIYVTSFLLIDHLVTASLPTLNMPAVSWITALCVLIGFAGLLGLQMALLLERQSHRLSRWHIHALNGFYIESTLRRLFGSLLSS